MTIFGEENDVVEQRINVRNTLGQHPNVKASIKMDARRQVKTVANTAFRRMDKIKKLVQSSNTVDIPEELIQELKSIIESES
ncbi:MAG: hypothetical protein NTZ16_16315, partial [Verrucomicrobia bacterium]|nr:hypothetical protein [Verrucomicrobiota bacterium]